MTRRGFLKRLGLGVAGVAIAPAVVVRAVMAATPAPKVAVPLVMSNRAGMSDVSRYFLHCGPRFKAAILKNFAETNPYAGLVDGGEIKTEPLTWKDLERTYDRLNAIGRR